MVKKATKTIFTCQSCGYQAPRWMGKCPECNQWQTFVEESRAPATAADRRFGGKSGALQPMPIDAIAVDEDQRLQSGIAEFDRVLGGGLVAGTLILIGGDPGVGKSTLMLQALHGICQSGGKVLYISGEESTRQLRLRSQRLNTISNRLWVVSEIDLDAVVRMIEQVEPQAVVIDSIQTMFNPQLTSAPGSVSQVRESTVQLMLMAKKSGVPVFLVGHVTKDGMIAGPRLLEHMVDTVLYFEGERNHVFRILRAVKNRFGSTNEIGVFEMHDSGLREVPNPSAVFLSERPVASPGSAVTASIEGTRPILVELQALASNSMLGTPRRTILGLDANRVALLVAVLEKKIGLQLMGHDLFMNVAGGVKIDEPAVDLAIIAAVASSFIDKPITDNTLILGEVGLTGEVRGIGHVDVRVAEAAKMGFSRCLLPQNNMRNLKIGADVELIGVANVPEAMELIFS